jgi:acetate kinase
MCQKKAAQILGKDYNNFKVITCHLGNGGSIAAVKDGHSIDTTMGFTPLEGLVMGTRSGDIDPAIIPYIMQKENLNPREIDDLLNKSSGLKGITKTSSDMREIMNEVENNSEQHKLALEMYCYRIKKYIGAYYAILGGVDAIVFTAGVGENNPIIRRMACQGLECIGVDIDSEKNGKNSRIISSGQVSVMVIPTNEEMAIAQETYSVITEKQRSEAVEKEAMKSRKELEMLSEADKAKIAIIWSKNEKLSLEELYKVIEKETDIKITPETFKVLLSAMGFIK